MQIWAQKYARVAEYIRTLCMQQRGDSNIEVLMNKGTLTDAFSTTNVLFILYRAVLLICI